MKLNETVWAAVYKDRPEIIAELSVSKDCLIETLNSIGYKRSMFKFIRVRIVPVKEAKRGKG